MSTLEEMWRLADPGMHCYREDGCARHGDYAHDHDGSCCCCGRPAGEHTGCDCEEES